MELIKDGTLEHLRDWENLDLELGFDFEIRRNMDPVVFRELRSKSGFTLNRKGTCFGTGIMLRT